MVSLVPIAERKKLCRLLKIDDLETYTIRSAASSNVQGQGKKSEAPDSSRDDAADALDDEVSPEDIVQENLERMAVNEVVTASDGGISTIAEAVFSPQVLSELRKSAGLSVKKLSEAAKVSYQQLLNIEHGKSTPRTATIQKLGQALDVVFIEGLNVASPTERQFQLNITGSETTDSPRVTGGRAGADSAGIPDNWFQLAKWAEGNDNIAPWERRFCLTVGRQLEQQQKLTNHGQASMNKIWAWAMENGFEPEN